MHASTLWHASEPVEIREAFASADGLCMKLLGAPQITLRGVPLALRRRKAQALLMYLAVTGGPHPREALARLLAGNTTDDLARKHLRTALSDLSDQIGDYLVVTRRTISLARSPRDWLDVEQFTALVETSDPAVLERTVAMYEDAFLTGFVLRDAPRFEAWVLQEQQHLQALLVRALHRLLDQAINDGDTTRAIAIAQRLLDEEPWCEETHRRLIWLLARAGRRSEALDQYASCRRIIAQNLSSEPEPATAALYERLRVGAAPPPHNVPAASNPMIGRECETATLLRELEDPASRLITLLGLGGSGKTCLALEVARRVVAAEAVEEHPFSDGVYVVDLAALRPRRHGPDAGAMARSCLVKAIGRVLDVRFPPSADPAAHLLTYLRSRSLLLILDNFEQLHAGAAILQIILQRAPAIKLMVTSRTRLGIVEERILPVGGLALPSGSEDIEQAEAGRLFLQQAQHVRMNRPLSGTDRAHIVRICHLVQGFPLALIHAANWLSGLSCAVIAAELAGGIDLLAATDVALPERQRSMRGILDSLWKELPVAEQTAMRQLAVFKGGFTGDAAQMMAGASTSLLHTLSERMLLDRDERERYTMHELVRLYAAEQLAAQPEEEAQAQARHAMYYAAQVQHYAPMPETIPNARDAIGEDIYNIRSAWDWAIAHLELGLLEQMRMGLAQWHYRADLSREWIERTERAVVQVRATLAGDGTPNPALQRLLGYLLLCEAEAHIWHGHDGPARGLLDEISTIARATLAPGLEAHCIYYQAWIMYRRGKGDAMLLAEQALATARVARAEELGARCLWLLGVCSVALADYPQACRYFDRALPTLAACEDRPGSTDVNIQQGIIAHEQGAFATARSYLADSMAFFRLQGNRPGELLALYYSGLVCDAELGRHVEAQQYLAQALAIAHQLGDMHLESMARAGRGQNALLQGDFQGARSAFEHALGTCQEIGSQAFTAPVLRGLGMLAHYLGDDWRARELAQQSLHIAHKTGQRRATRFAQRLLGHALVGLGALAEAAVAYQQTLELDYSLGYLHLALEAGADLASVALAQGDLDQAAAFAAPILTHLQGHGLQGLEEPVQVYLICYRVLKATGDPRAEAVLAAGHDLLQQRATQFADEASRSRFLQNLPAHRAITHLAAHAQLAPSTVPSNRAGLPS